jgi:hypothetical protein
MLHCIHFQILYFPQFYVYFRWGTSKMQNDVLLVPIYVDEQIPEMYEGNNMKRNNECTP